MDIPHVINISPNPQTAVRKESLLSSFFFKKKKKDIEIKIVHIS